MSEMSVSFTEYDILGQIDEALEEHQEWVAHLIKPAGQIGAVLAKPSLIVESLPE